MSHMVDASPTFKPEACPGMDDLSAFAAGNLPDERLEELAEHVSGCAACAAAVQQRIDQTANSFPVLQRLKDGTPPPEDTLRVVALAGRAEKDGAFVVGQSAAPLRPAPKQLREYRLLEKLGEGGMGAVYRALHTRLDKIVALKVLSPERTNNQDAVARFQREMRAVGKLNHAHIVQATDAGEVDGTLFLVMECVEGSDLATLVARRGPLPVAEACAIIQQAALGLQSAHEHGLVHRDVKPSNLMLTPAGQVKILDLGLARLQDAPASPEMATASFTVMGSLDYMAPEQALDPHNLDARADLYSLGCTLFYLLTGRVPFPDPPYHTPFQKMNAHAHLPPANVRALQPGIPEGIAHVLDKLLTKSPAHRFRSAAELVKALTPYSRNADLSKFLRQPGAWPLGAARPETTTVSSPVPDWQPRAPIPERGARRTSKFARWGIAAACLGAMLLAATVIYVQTDKGVLEITTHDDDVKISVLQSGKEIELIDLQKNKRIRIRVGEYDLKVIEGGQDLVVKPGSVSLKRGVTTVAEVTRKKQPVALVPPAGKFPPLAPSWLNAVATMSPADQADAVAKELQKRNPEFDGRVQHQVEDDQVKALSFSSEHVADITPVRALVHLKSLACNGASGGKSKLADLSPLKGMSLTTLHLNATPVKDLTPLEGMPLEELFLAWTKVADLSPVKHMPLKTLDCNFVPTIKDLTPLKGLPLKTFHCVESKVSDLTPLKDVTGLEELVCANTPVADLTPLQKLPLNMLNCSGSRVTDLRGLQGMKSLEILHIKFTPVKSLAPLQGLSVRELVCDEALLADTEVLRSLKKLDKINEQPAAMVVK